MVPVYRSLKAFRSFQKFAAGLKNRQNLFYLVVAALVFYPLMVDDFYIEIFSKALIFGIYALSVDILWGYTGIFTLGHAAFFGLGAYTYTITTQNLNFQGTTYLAIVLAVVLPVILAMILGFACFYSGTHEVYFVIVTLAIATIFEKTAQVWDSVTGGFNGLINIPYMKVDLPLKTLFVFDRTIKIYYLVAASSILVYLFGRRLVDSPAGRVMQAVRENPTRTEFLGYEVTRYRLYALMLSAAIAGFSGALFAPLNGIVSTDLFGFVLSASAVMWVAIGGIGTLVGAFLGAVFMNISESLLGGLFVKIYLLMMGSIFVLVVIFFPKGMAEFIKRFALRGSR